MALSKDGLRYVIKKDDPALIASFVNLTNQANAHTLDVLWSGSPIETFEKVLDEVDFPQQALVDFATFYGVFSPRKFPVFLKNIVKPEDQEKAVENAIERVVGSFIGPSPLLNALKGKTFRSERLEYFAIQKAFMKGVKKDNVNFLPEGICNHAAIAPELYADALIIIAEWGKHHPLRPSLLKNADRYDLEAVKEKAGYEGLNAGFRDAIEEALKTAALGGTRTRTHDIQTVEKAEETFADLGHPGISEDVFNIISDSVALDAPARRESQTASKKAAKKVASDISSTLTTKTEGSGDIGSERVGEDQA